MKDAASQFVERMILDAIERLQAEGKLPRVKIRLEIDPASLPTGGVQEPEPVDIYDSKTLHFEAPLHVTSTPRVVIKPPPFALFDRDIDLPPEMREECASCGHRRARHQSNPCEGEGQPCTCWLFQVRR